MEEPEECGGRKTEDGGWRTEDGGRRKRRLRSSFLTPYSLPSLFERG